MRQAWLARQALPYFSLTRLFRVVQAVYVKYHFKTDQGIRNLPAEEADRLGASDPDYAIRDLYNSIAEGACPSWTLYVQVMTYAQAQV